MQSLKRFAGPALAILFLFGTLILGAPAPAQNVSVTVNGQAMSFDQPPVMRNNRVFVPMRAIFERLGSTVVFSGGIINAHGNGHDVHLTIGSTQASVNGQPLTMDVAPFEVAGRTEVPLRFVAQALGAHVNWNPNASTVAITTSGGNVSYGPANERIVQSERSASQQAAVSASTTHPAIRAGFSEPINRDSLRVAVDGRDVTPQVYANDNGFNVTTNSELTPGNHRVAVTGTTAAGASFNTGWSFTTAAGSAANTIRRLSPGPGARVGSSFTLSGRTTPGSTVHIVASGSASAMGGLFQVGTGTFQTDVTADGNGYFSAPIALNAVSGGQVRVIITSTSPGGASIEQQVVYSS